MFKEEGSVLIIGILIGLLVAGGLLGAYYLGKQNKSSILQQPPQIKATTLPTVQSTPSDETVNWTTYTNTKYGYSFKYPNDPDHWEVGAAIAGGQRLQDDKSELADGITLLGPTYSKEVPNQKFPYMDLDIFEDNNLPSIGEGLTITKTQPVKLGDMQTTEYIAEGEVMDSHLKYSYVVTTVNHMRLQLATELDTNADPGNKIYYQILSTFKSSNN